MIMICFADRQSYVVLYMLDVQYIGETVANEGQQPPLPQQGPSEQQSYTSWQYDQDNPDQMEQQSPVGPAQPIHPTPQYSPAYVPPNQGVPPQPPPSQNPGGPSQPLPQQNQGVPPQPVPPQYQRPVQDM